jgi:hypothetical protein
LIFPLITSLDRHLTISLYSGIDRLATSVRSPSNLQQSDAHSIDSMVGCLNMSSHNRVAILRSVSAGDQVSWIILIFTAPVASDIFRCRILVKIVTFAGLNGYSVGMCSKISMRMPKYNESSGDLIVKSN